MALLSFSKLRILDMKTFEEISVLHPGLGNLDFGISPNGQLIWCWSRGRYSDKQQVFYLFQLWNLGAREPRPLLELKSLDGPMHVEVSPDGQLVALMFRPRKDQREAVRLIEVATGRDRGTIPCHPYCEPIFHPDCQLIVSVKDDGLITGWNTNCLSEKFSLQRTGISSVNDILNLVMTPTGKLVVLKRDYISGSLPTLHLWETSTGKEIGSYGMETLPSELRLSDDGRYLTCHQGRLPLPSSIPRDEQPDTGKFQEDWQDLLYVGWEWVYQGLTRLLWLPPQYQSLNVTARGETVAFGTAISGSSFLNLTLLRHRW